MLCLRSCKSGSKGFTFHRYQNHSSQHYTNGSFPANSTTHSPNSSSLWTQSLLIYNMCNQEVMTGRERWPMIAALVDLEVMQRICQLSVKAA